MPNQFARVDTADAGDTVAGEILSERALGAPVTRYLAILAHHKSFGKGVTRFYIFRINSVISYLGIGHDNDLPGIGGICQDLLIAGDRGVKDDLATGLACSAKTLSLENQSILKYKKCSALSQVTLP
jgi:hypothetical protein